MRCLWWTFSQILTAASSNSAGFNWLHNSVNVTCHGAPFKYAPDAVRKIPSNITNSYPPFSTLSVIAISLSSCRCSVPRSLNQLALTRKEEVPVKTVWVGKGWGWCLRGVQDLRYPSPLHKPAFTFGGLLHQDVRLVFSGWKYSYYSTMMLLRWGEHWQVESRNVWSRDARGTRITQEEGGIKYSSYQYCSLSHPL